MKLITKPETYTETAYVTSHRTELREGPWLFGVIPTVERVLVPVETLVYAGRYRTRPFEVEGWPYPIGEKVHKVEIEGMTLLGVFALKATERGHICCFDALEDKSENHIINA